MYSKEERDEIQNSIIALAQKDNRIKDCAIVGSESIGKHDKWSDIDLTFGIDDETEISQILSEWNAIMFANFNANVLFDVEYKESIYRVYLLPNALQVDLSFTPTQNFGAITNAFKLIFGKANHRQHKPEPELSSILGYSILYALKSRCAIEREKYWQAIFYLDKFRENIMTMKCISLHLNPFDGRSFDELPNSFLNKITTGLTGELNRDTLKNSLRSFTKILIQEIKQDNTIAYTFENELKRIASL